MDVRVRLGTEWAGHCYLGTAPSPCGSGLAGTRGSCKNRRFGGTWRLLHQGDKNQ
jgi:hypothetical protein